MQVDTDIQKFFLLYYQIDTWLWQMQVGTGVGRACRAWMVAMVEPSKVEKIEILCEIEKINKKRKT
ncbi:uncharacterized protein DS421_16g530440 [Arachis hypogaea]|nr:uncharacterized protein DS421_16g530440 [Arachis hypogaea]